MTKFLMTIFATSLFMSIPSPVHAKSPTVRPPIFTLEKLPEEEKPSGCSCSIQNARGDYIFGCDLLEKSTANVRIEGKRRDLKWVSSTEKAGGLKKGDTFKREYADGTTKLKLTYRAMFVCPPDSETCEVTRYSINAVLQDGIRKIEFKNLRGECGC